MPSPNWYVSALAGGGGAGTPASPWTFAEAFAAINALTVANGDTVWAKADGTYTTAGVRVTAAGLATAFKTFAGYSATIGDGGRALIRRSGGAVNLLNFNKHFWRVKNLELDGQNAGNNNLYSVSVTVAENIESYAAGSQGLHITWKMFNCYAHNNGGHGIFGGQAWNCLSENNAIGGLVTCHTVNCIGANNVSTNFYHGNNSYSFNCISYGGNAHGIQLAGYAILVMNAIVVNSPAARFGLFIGTSDGHLLKNINFHNCVQNCDDIGEIDTYYNF